MSASDSPAKPAEGTLAAVNDNDCEHCIHPADEHHALNQGGGCCVGIYVDPVTEETSFCTCTWDGVMDCGRNWVCPDCRAGVPFWDRTRA